LTPAKNTHNESEKNIRRGGGGGGGGWIERRRWFDESIRDPFIEVSKNFS
jgi:hypothetical protein